MGVSERIVAGGSRRRRERAAPGKWAAESAGPISPGGANTGRCQVAALLCRTEVRRTRHLNLTATLLTQARLPQTQIDTFDLSTGGLGFSSAWPFQSGDRFVVPMRLDDRVEMLLLCQVISCNYLERGTYRVGAKFIDSVTTDSQTAIPDMWIQEALAGN